jgi:hypothetical protein
LSVCGISSRSDHDREDGRDECAFFNHILSNDNLLTTFVFLLLEQL